MLPTESVAEFKSFASGRGVAVLATTPQVGFTQMFDFYAGVQVEGCARESGDMLLFQWGAYDWGNGATYEVNLTRQFIELAKHDDDAISQLSFTFHFSPSDALKRLGEGNRWCESHRQLPEFRQFVLGSPQVELELSSLQRVELRHGYV